MCPLLSIATFTDMCTGDSADEVHVSNDDAMQVVDGPSSGEGIDPSEFFNRFRLG